MLVVLGLGRRPGYMGYLQFGSGTTRKSEKWRRSNTRVASGECLTVSVITQKLDLTNDQTVNNFIQFEGGGKFSVTGSTETVDGDDEYDRVAFEFQEATAVVWGKEIHLPPVGTGWFDTMFCDRNLRLSRDSRGDWSVFRRIE